MREYGHGKKNKLKKFKELKFRALIWSPIPIAIKKKTQSSTSQPMPFSIRQEPKKKTNKNSAVNEFFVFLLKAAKKDITIKITHFRSLSPIG
jgi:hypothetical protein